MAKKKLSDRTGKPMPNDDVPVDVTLPTVAGVDPNAAPVDVTLPTVAGVDPTAADSTGVSGSTVKLDPNVPPPRNPLPPARKTASILKDGEKLGKYIIVKRLGKGGMGEVYLGRHEQLGILRAIKVLPQDLAQKNPQFLSRFMREAKTACEIRHSNIVNVMDVGNDTERALSYIVMEFVDGGDVRGLLKSSGHLTVDQSLVIVEAVCSALVAAAEFGIVHRDIKPDNIMLTKRGEVKLADLGIAKSEDEDVQLTMTNVMMGTPAYLPPEQAKDAKRVDVRADIYSLGATFFEMLTGRIPYPGKSTYDILSQLYSAPVPNPCEFNPEVPPEIGKICMTMMAKKPENRYQSAAELLEVLAKSRAHQKTVLEAQQLIRDAIQTAYGTDAIHRPTTIIRRRKKKIYRIAAAAAGAALLLGVVIGISIHLAHRPKSGHPDPDAAEIAETRSGGAPSASGAAKRLRRTFRIHPAAAAIVLLDGAGNERAPLSRQGGTAVYDLPPEEFICSVMCDGFISQTGNFDPRTTTTAEFTLKPSVLTVHTEPGASVFITAPDGSEAAGGTADDKGFFSATGLKAGRHVLQAVLAGRKQRREEFSFGGNAAETREFRLVPLDSALKLHRLNFTLDPVDAAVTLRDDKGHEIPCSTKLGSLCSYELPAGFYLYSIGRPGCVSQEGTCRLSGDTDIPKVTLKPYRVTVSAAPGTKVEILRNFAAVAAATVGTTGEAVFPAIPGGNYLLRGRRDGYIPLTRKIEIPAERDAKFEISLQEEFWEFQIQAPNGCRMVLRRGEKTLRDEVFHSDQLMLKLPRGDYQAEFTREDYLPRTLRFRIPDDQRTVVRMERGVFNLTLHVVPDKVRVDLKREDGKGTPLRLHMSGTRSINGLTPGNYHLTVFCPGYEEYRETFTLSEADEARHITLKKVFLSGGDSGGIIIREVKTGDAALDRFILQNGAEVKIKEIDLPWEKVRFPHTIKNLKAGRYHLLCRRPEKKIRGQESDEITVEPGRFTEYSMFLATF